jgi:hypothetical protein
LSRSRKKGAIQCSVVAAAERGAGRGVERGDVGEDERERERRSLGAGAQGASAQERREGAEQEYVRGGSSHGCR